MDNTEIAEYLEGGAAALASGELTWVQHTIGYIKDMTACAIGACNYAHHGNMYFEDCWGVMSTINAGSSINFPDYNDTPYRTKQEVIDALTLLAKDFRNAAA